MLGEELVSKQKSPRLLTTGREGKNSRSWKCWRSPESVSVKEFTLNGAFAFSNKSFIRRHKALGSKSSSTRPIMSNNRGQDCWRSRRSSGHCFIGILSTNFLYNSPSDSNCGRRAHTGEEVL